MKIYKLGEICKIYGRIGFRGYTIKDLVESPQDGAISLSPSNFVDGEINLSKCTYITWEKYYESPEIMISKGDIIIVKTGSSYGRSTIVRSLPHPMTLNPQLVVLKDIKVDPLYLFYFIKSPVFQKEIKGIAGGSAIPTLSQENLSNLTVMIPKKEEQDRIVEIINPIDKKIALNRQINDNLEAMARQLYDYWFVQFDFPDKNGKPYKSSGGKFSYSEKLKREVPEKWKVGAIAEVSEVYNGATPSTSDPQNYGGEIVWITPKDLSDQQQKFVYHAERNITQKGYDSCSTHLLPCNTILMSSRAPIGLLAISKTELCTNQGFKSFVPKNEIFSTYLYYYLQVHIQQIEQLGTGTTFKEVSRDDVLRFPILLPDDRLISKWEDIVAPINEKQLKIQKENEELTKQRDELLPLLMNGQVSVNYHLSDD